MRLLVVGKEGQVARALAERAPALGVEVERVGRPEFDLAADPASVARVLAGRRADAVVNAAAYTAVDRAESEQTLAAKINGLGAGAVATAARSIGAPVLHLSTDYVFDGLLDRPYREDDATHPTTAYGRSKLAGETAVAAANEAHIILRTAWVYSPFGANFVKTMLRFGESRAEVGVVADQLGSPTSALDIADALIAVAKRCTAAEGAREVAGLYHMSGSGETTWAHFAEAVFALAEQRGRKPVAVRRIATKDYPTVAHRPANSRLDNAKLERVFGVRLPAWRESLQPIVFRLLADA
jgi:dTDP-4-dehydrorhamnose reductase